METLVFTIKSDVQISQPAEDHLLLAGPISRLELSNLSAGGVAVIRQLAADGLSDPDMRALVAQHDGPAGMFRFLQLFPRLVGAGMICYTLCQQEERLAMLEPLSPYFRRNKDDIPADARFQLSRFAFLHLEDGRLLLESPLGFGRIILYQNDLVTLLGLLRSPHSWQSAADALGSLPADLLHAFFQLLLSIQALTPLEGESAQPAEDEIMRQWDFHDLLFHSRTRYGRYDKPFDGSVQRFFGQIPMPPAVKPPMSEQPIPLYQPDLDSLRAQDPPLAEVMETRRTLYHYDEDRPITAEQLGEFLYRVGRVRFHYGEEHSDSSGYREYMDYTNRPYPGGGAMYELEFYLTVRHCSGLEAGLYHYDAEQHGLHLVAEMSPMVGAILGDAAGTTPFGQPPQVVITLAARFPRMFWKYNTLGYALILKNVGVLYQSMYLVATAMKLAPVAMGAGNADLFAQAAGLDYYAESSVGELSLASRAD